MTYWSLCGSTALATLVALSPAFADVTPDQVWQDWQDLAASYGQTFTTDQVTTEGNDLVISGLSLATEQEGVQAASRIDTLRFADQGDGTVKITMSDSFPVTMTLPSDAPGGTPTTVTLQVDQPGLEITASGDAGETRYDFAAPEYTVALKEVSGAEESGADVVAKIALTGLSGNYLFAPSETAQGRALTTSFAADSMTINLSGQDKAAASADSGATTPSSGSFTLTMADIAGTSAGTLLDAAAMVDMAAALKAGFKTEGNMTTGATSFAFEAVDANGPSKFTGTSDSSALNFAMDDTRMAYGGSSKGVRASFSSPDIPFPEVTLSYAEAAFNFLAPTGPSAEPADFALLTKLVDFSVSDEVWGLFDPAGQLPHDPATLVIDTQGTARLNASLFDSAAMEASGETPPGELNSLTVNELHAKIAGAELTGQGDFTFDNSDTTTFDGVPAPTGKLELKLTGGNALMDKLVAMGLLPEDQVSGLRMMLSMFANATGDDELSSTLEFKDKGFFANGQRLQ